MRHLAAILTCLFLLAAPAAAHDPWNSSAISFIRPDEWVVDLVINPEAAYLLIPSPPQTLHKRPSKEEFEKIVKPALLPIVEKALTIEVDGAPLVPLETDLYLNEEQDIGFWVRYPRPVGQSIKLEMSFMKVMIPEHTSSIDVYLSTQIEPIFWDLIDTQHYSCEFPCPRAPAPTAVDPATGEAVPPAAPAEAVQTIGPRFFAFLKMGMDHIWGGYDHLLFLAGLLIVCQKFSSIAKIITCFTIAHSITLAAAALNWVNLDGKLVEAAIAASIVYVGVENLFLKEEPKYRYVLTFLFGLIHGFGFAGYFRERIQGVSVIGPLLGFNLGVEIGQLAVVVVALPILWQLRKIPGFVKYAIPVFSLGVAWMGLEWLDERTGDLTGMNLIPDVSTWIFALFENGPPPNPPGK